MSKSIIKHISISVIIGFIFFIGLTAIAALIFLKIPVPQKIYMPTTVAIAVTGACISSVRSTLKTKEKGIVMGAIASALFDILLAVSVLCVSLEGPSGKLFAVAGIIFIIGTLSGIYAANLK